MQQLIFGQKTLSTRLSAFVMGILNATPDSFYASSRGGLERARMLINQGADILDIGGESTRPGFTAVSVEEEISRVVPLIKAIRKESDIAISVDTRKLEVLEAAFDAGADALNDITAFEYNPKLADFCGKNNLSVIITHNFFAKNDSTPKIEYDVIKESDKKIIDTVKKYLLDRIDFAKSCGIQDKKIILDPGIGFGKTFGEDCCLIKNINEICSLNYPVLMALSRKRCIGKMTEKDGILQAENERLSGTIAADLLSVINGVRLLRVHDVKETVDSLQVLKYNI